MTSPRKSLIVSYVLFWIAVLIVVEVIIFASANAKPALDALQQAQKSEQSESPILPQEPQEAPQNNSESISTPVPVKSTEAAPQVSTGVEVPGDQGGHIPFTQKPVTPGDPETYVDTVGQCPFYEMGGPKGCSPPADIECNADWSECHPRQP